MIRYWIFEGVDGSGKTSLIDDLRRKVSPDEFWVEVLREPYDYPREVKDFFGQLSVQANNEWLKVYYHQVGRMMLQKTLRQLQQRQRSIDSRKLLVFQDRSFVSTMVYQAFDLGLYVERDLLESFWMVIAKSALETVFIPDQIFLMEPPAEYSDTYTMQKLKSLYREATQFLSDRFFLKVRRLPPGFWKDPSLYERIVGEILGDLRVKTPASP